jgi:hypothetical protein
MDTFWIIVLCFGPFFAWLLFQRVPNCPDCGNLLSSLQSPFTKTSRQWLDGGYLCQNCGCEATRAGLKVVEGSVPKYHPKVAPRMLAFALALPLVVVIFTCFLLVVLLRQH